MYRSRWRVRGAVAALVTLALVVSAVGLDGAGATAAAPNAPGATAPLTVTASNAAVLAGGQGRVEVTASNPGGVVQYNATTVVVLPVGAGYVSGSAQPTAPNSIGDPTVFTFAPDPLQPTVTQQVLQWANIADLPTGASLELSFAVALDPARYPVGSSATADVGVYANANEREVPTATVPPNGPPVVGDATSRGAAPFTISVPGVTLVKSVDARESEVYRGPANPAVYTLTVTTAPEAGSTAVEVTDLVPAQLQVTACNLGALDCTRATVVVGGVVFTRLTWSLGTVAAGTVRTLAYSAFVGERALTASGAADGAPTRSTGTGYTVTNTAELRATYTGALASGTPALQTVSAQRTVRVLDAGVVKSHPQQAFVAGGTLTYTLAVRTGQFTTAADLVLTDVVPDGMCPFIPAGTPVTGVLPSDCPAVGAGTVTGATMTGVTVNADGTFTITLGVPPRAADQDATVTYSTYMRDRLRNGVPTTAGESFVNTVDLTATTSPATGNTVDVGTAAVSNDSFSSLASGGLSIDKTVWTNPSRSAITGVAGSAGTTCENAPSSEYVSTAGPSLRLGDLACFRIAVSFPTGVATRDALLADSLPPGTELVDWATVPGSTATVVQQGTAATWRLGDLDAADGSYYVGRGQTLTLDVLGRVTSTPTTLPTVTGNLAKLRYSDAVGRTVSVRDDAGFAIAPAVPLSLVKRTSGQSSAQVREGDAVPFTLSVTHDGTSASRNDYPLDTVEVWDVLPAGFGCADLSALTPTPTGCSAPSSGRAIVVWTLSGALLGADQRLTPGETVSMTYTLTVPAPLSLNTEHVNTAAVTRYTAPTTDGITPGSGTFYPTNPVGAYPGQTANAPQAADSVTLSLPAAAVTKVVSSTSENVAGNGPTTQATIGETVVYDYTVTIPARTSVFNGILDDNLPVGAALTQSGAPVLIASPTGLTVGTSCTASATDFELCADGRLLFPTTWTNTGADAAFTVRLATTVAAIAGNVQGTAIPNTARFTSSPTASAAAVSQGQATASVAVVEPSPTLRKTASVSQVSAGQTYTYTLEATDAAGRPPLYDGTTIDCVPGGLVIGTLPSDMTGPEPGTGANGCAVGQQKLTWTLGSPLAAGTARSVTYPVTVPADVVSGVPFVNTATLTGSSLPGVVSGERTYTSSVSRSVAAQKPTVVKNVSSTTVVPGQALTWTVAATIPANVSLYNATFTDPLPSVFGAASNISSWSLACTGGDAAWQSGCVTGTRLASSPSTTFGVTVGDIPASTVSRTLTLTFVVSLPTSNASATNTSVTNTGSFRWNYDAGPPPTTTNATFSDVVSGARTVTIRQPAVTTAKSVSVTSAAQGQTFTYTVTPAAVAGTNNVPAYDVVVVDTVPSGIVVLSGGVPIADGSSTTSGGVWNAASRTLTWTLASLTPGTNNPLTYTARFAPAAGLTGAPVSNSVRPASWASLATGGRTNYGPGSAATASVTPLFPRIAATKTQVTPTNPVYRGDEVTFRVVLTNTGGATAASFDAVDTLPAGWSYVAGSAEIAIRSDAPAKVEPSATGQTLRWTSIGGATVNLAPGQTVTITYSATPGPGAPIGRSIAQTNTATAANVADATGGTSYNSGAGSYIGTTGSATARIDSADLAVTKVANADFVAGGTGTWTVTVRNLGPDPAAGVALSDATTVPAGVTLRGALNAAAQGWTCTPPDGAGAFACSRTNAAETLASGSTWSLTVSADVAAGVPGGTTIQNTATVSARTADPASGNNAASATATTTASADLAVTKTASPSTVVAGTPITWQIALVNAGPSVSRGSAADPVRLTDVLPTSFVSPISVTAATNGAQCSIAAGTLSCDVPHDLAVGETVVVTLGGTVLSTVDPGSSIVNTATVAPVTTDPVPANDTSTVTTATTVQESLTISKTILDPPGSAVPGETITYRLQVSNGGPSSARGVVVDDPLPAGLSYDAIVAGGGAWTASTSGGVLRLSRGAPLGANTSSTVDVRVRVASSVSGELTNTATVSSTWRANQATSSATTGTTASADLTLQKTASPTTVVAGDATGGTFTLRAENTGPSDAAGPITITDTMPVGMTVRGGVPAECAVDSSGASPIITCTRSAALVAGDDWEVVIPFSVAAGVTATQLTNTAVVSSPTPDPSPSGNTATAVVDVQQRAALSVTKTPSVTTVQAGDTLTWSIEVTNVGPSDAQLVQLGDTVDPRMQVVSVTAPDGVSCGSGSPVLCTVGTLAPTATTTVVVTTRVLPSVADGATIPNSATATSTTTDPSTGAPATATGQDSVSVTSESALTLTKTTSTPTVDAGAVAVFDLTLGNTDLSDTTTPVTVTDTLPAGMTYLGPAATVGGPATWSCTPSSQGRVVTCVLEQGGSPASLAAGATAPVLRVSASVAASTPASTLTNGASATAANSSPVGASADVIVQTRADLGVTKTHSPAASAVPGSPFTWTVTVTNHGPSDSVASVATPITVTDVLPVGVSLDTANPSGGPDTTCAETGSQSGRDVVTCVRTTTLPAGASAAITLRTVLDAALTGTIVNEVAVAPGSTPQTSTNVWPDTATDSVVLAPSADLGVVKTVDGAVVAGADVSWTVAVTNAGPSVSAATAGQPITVVDTLPAGVGFVSATGSGWSCTPATAGAATQVTCLRTTDLPVGAAPAITVTGSVGAGAQGATIENTAVLTPGATPQPSPGLPDTSSVSALVTESADLAIVKTIATTIVAGGTGVYALQVSNAGPSDARAVEVTDTLPVGLAFDAVVPPAGGGASPWTCAAQSDPQTVVCTLGAPLAAGVTTTIDLRVAAATSLQGDVINTAVVSSATPDPDPSNNSSSVDGTVAQTAQLSIAKTVVGTPEIDGAFGYEIAVGNAGPSLATAVVVTDLVPPQLAVTAVSAASPWVCTTGSPDATGTLVTCTLPSLAPGAAPGVIAIAVTADVAAYPAVSNTATVDAPESPAASSTVTSPIPPRSDLAIRTDLVGPLVPGREATYRITVGNRGATEDPGPVVVTDDLPDGLTGVSAVLESGAGTCEVTARRMVCTIPRLDAGGEIVIRLVTAVSPSARGTIVNTASAESIVEPLPVSASATGQIDVSSLPVTGGGDPGGLLRGGALVLLVGTLLLWWTGRRRRPGDGVAV